MKKMHCLKVGDPDRNGERDIVFQVEATPQPITYNVRARSVNEAAERLRPYVEMDAAAMQELGVVGTGVTVIVIIGAMVAGVAALGRHLQGKPVLPGKKVKPKKNPVINGIEVEEIKTAERSNQTDGSPDEAESAARSSSPFSAARRAVSTAARAASRMGTWRPINYNGAQGKIAGDDPTQGLKIVVFSDTPIDPFLSLARPSVYDQERSMLRDAVSVLTFPTLAAINMRPQGAFEVMVGGNPSREFDVHAPSVEAALAGVRDKLARYL